MSREEKHGGLVQQVSTMLLEQLTQGGHRNLTDLRLDDLENEVSQLADSISQCVAEGLLERQAENLGKGTPRCPCCQGLLEPKPPQERTLLLRRGEVQWEEPVWRCPPCRRDFLPQSAVMGCAVETECSPAVETKVVSAATRSRSYAEASGVLRDLAELNVSSKRCARITQRIGRERLRERSDRAERFDDRSLPEQKRGVPCDAPANGWEGRVAAVIVDGGRAQLRDERWGTPKEPGERRKWWREPKIGCVATFQSRESAEDPLPEIPACLLDPLFVIPRVLEMKRTRAADIGRCEKQDKPTVLPETLASAMPPTKSERWSPPPLVQSVVGTLGTYEDLGRLIEVEAWHRGFAAAPRKVFLGDGLPVNWTMHRERFSHYVPVVDLMHAIAYVYTAAIESSSEMSDCWQRYCRWICATWRGKVSDVLSELKRLIADLQPEPRATVEDCHSYLSNNAPRMRYDAYRRMGLPITTALGESKIKQINRRMKGTEKFWRDGAEPQLQLCCDQLSETDPLKGFWSRRAARQNGFRKSRSSG